METDSPETAQVLMNSCNGMEVDGRPLTVRLDNKPEKPAGGNTTNKRGLGDPALANKPENSSGTQIVVRNLAWNVTSEMLEGTYAQIGKVVQAEVIYHQDSGRSKGWGTVKFENPAEAQDAIERFAQVELAGRPMVVRMDRFN